MRRLLLITVLALGAGAAYADEGQGLLYVGAGIVRDNVKDIAATNSDLNSTDWKAMVGFRPISLFAVEADYLDLGSETFSSEAGSAHLHYKAAAAYAVGFAPIPVPYLDVFGKVGLARWTQSGGSSFFPSSSFFSLSDSGTQFAWGVGAQVHIGNVGARLEYENFNIRNTNGANVVSLSVYLALL
jgi:Outer membrane protein beta-barrel domain